MFDCYVSPYLSLRHFSLEAIKIFLCCCPPDCLMDLARY